MVFMALTRIHSFKHFVWIISLYFLYFIIDCSNIVYIYVYTSCCLLTLYKYLVTYIELLLNMIDGVTLLQEFQEKLS